MPGQVRHCRLDRQRVQAVLDLMMTRLLTVLCPVVLAITAAGCGSTKETPPREAQFVTNDCDLIAAIGKERYKLNREDPPRRLRLNGEDAPWKPNCDWQAL